MQWIQQNTPESALIVALATVVAGFFAGALSSHDAFDTAWKAVGIFIAAEAYKDAHAPIAGV